MKILLIAFGIFLLWNFFHRGYSFLGFLAMDASSTILNLVLALTRALLYGYFVYALFAVYGNFTRITTPGDIFTILAARPSAVGGAGILGVIAGVAVAITAFNLRAVPTPGPLQGRNVTVETNVNSFKVFVVRMAASMKAPKRPRK